MSGDHVYIGDQSATEALAEAQGLLTITLSNDTQSIPVDSGGDYAVFPDVNTEIRVYHGGTDVTASAIVSASGVNITGELTEGTDCYIYTPASLVTDSGYAIISAVYNNGTDTFRATKRFNLYKAYAGATGPNGAPGADGRLYFIESDVDAFKLGQNDVFQPTTVTYSAYYRDGSAAARTPYVGRIEVEVTKNGVDWETVIYPLENVTSVTYTPDDPDITGVRCRLYASGDFDDYWYGLSTDETGDYLLVDSDSIVLLADYERRVIEETTQLDIAQTAVVVDVSALSQNDVFNILTNNGQIQGIYLHNGKVYINAQYIQSGALIVRDKNDNIIFNADITNKTVQIAGEYVSIGGVALATALANATEAAVDEVNGALTQAEVFKRLTNNGAAKGLVLKDGQLYISFSYAQGGTLKLGGANNGYGLLQILDANDNVIGTWNNSGITINKGAININNGVFKVTNSGAVTAKSFTANDYIYLNGGSGSYLKMPFTYTKTLSGTNIAADGTVEIKGTMPLKIEGTIYPGTTSSAAYSTLLSLTDLDIRGPRSRVTASPGVVSLYNTTNGSLPIIKLSLSDGLSISSGSSNSSTSLLAYFGSNGYLSSKGARINGDFVVSTGYSKNKAMETEDYGERLLYSYEMPSPFFGDIGEGQIGEDGDCYVQVDPVFLQTISTKQYQVFLQAYGDGKCYVKERHPGYFIVSGEPGLEFGWEIKAKQVDTDQARLNVFDRDPVDTRTKDYGQEGYEHLIEIENERRNPNENCNIYHGME